MLVVSVKNSEGKLVGQQMMAPVPEGARTQWFVPRYDWWADFEVSRLMLGPLPSVVRYLARQLVRHDLRAQAILRTHWVASVGARWLTDITMRQVMWRLSPLVTRCMTNIEVEAFARGAEFSAAQVTIRVELHDCYDWPSHRNQRRTTTGFVWEPASSVRILGDGLCAIDLAQSAHPGSGLLDRPASPRHPRPEGGGTFGPYGSDWAAMLASRWWYCPRFKGSALSGPTSTPPPTDESRFDSADARGNLRDPRLPLELSLLGRVRLPQYRVV